MKRTFQPNFLVKKRKHGYLARKSTKSGQRILKNRMSKGRKYLAS